MANAASAVEFCNKDLVEAYCYKMRKYGQTLSKIFIDSYIISLR